MYMTHSSEIKAILNLETETSEWVSVKFNSLSQISDIEDHV